jgi:hypothetical protein
MFVIETSDKRTDTTEVNWQMQLGNKFPTKNYSLYVLLADHINLAV